MKSIITRDENTRFHACERFNRCSHVNMDGNVDRSSHAATTANKTVKGKHIVYVNPVTMGAASWTLYLKETREKFSKGEVVNVIVRISTPSLDAIVSEVFPVASPTFSTLGSPGITGICLLVQTSPRSPKHARSFPQRP